MPSQQHSQRSERLMQKAPVRQPRDGRAHTIRRLTLAAACFGFFMVILDTTVVNVALPSLQLTVGASLSGLQWVVDGYTLVFASLLLLTGALSDRFGSKRVFLAGLLIFTLASALCAASPTLELLITARVLQGMGAALLVPASLAIITFAYPEERTRAQAIGVWAAIAAIAAAAGPVIGGLLVESAGWRTVFLINVPVGLLGTVLTARLVSVETSLSRHSLDGWGQLTSITALAALTVALIEGGPLGWYSPFVVFAFVVFVAAGSIFLLVEKHSASPLLPLTLFQSPTFVATTAIGLLLNFSYYGLLFLLSLFFQQVQGDSAWETGLRLLPLTAINVVGTTLSGQLTARIGPRLPIAGGLALCAAGMFVFLEWGNSASTVLVILFFLLIGFGSALVVPALTAALLGTVERFQAGIASGVLNTSRQTGGVFGVAVLGSFVGSASGDIAWHAIQGALAVAGAVLVIGCVIAWLMIPSKKEQF